MTTFTFTGRIRSFRYAMRGVGLMVASQHNAWVHLLATAAVVVVGLATGLDRFEWCWMVIACIAVLSAEALNTALEFLCDVASPGFHPGIKNAKDVSAGAVLLSAVGAIAIGALILGPHLWRFFR